MHLVWMHVEVYDHDINLEYFYDAGGMKEEIMGVKNGHKISKLIQNVQ